MPCPITRHKSTNQHRKISQHILTQLYPNRPPLTEISFLTEVDRQLIQIKKDIAVMGRALIQNRTDMLEVVKKEIENNQAQHKALIETTINTTMTAFFIRQEETNKKFELARLADKKDSHQQRLAQQRAEAEEKKQSKIEYKSKMDLETKQRDNQMNTMFNEFLVQMKQNIHQTITQPPPAVTPIKTQDSMGSKQKGKRSNSPGSPLRKAPPLRSQELNVEMNLVFPTDSEEENKTNPPNKEDQTEDQEKNEPKIRENPLNTTPPTPSVDEEMA